jgi:stearoyl-CoA desaturase (delta-9 desaturase)
VTGDDSRNNWWLAVITLGEGWHNNHHAYQRSTRQGFRWYEFDPTFYLLTVMSWIRLVWELGTPPADVVRNERRLGRAVVEKVAHQLAAQFLAAQAHIPHLPSLAEIRARAEQMYADSPSTDEIVARARELIHHALSADPAPARSPA